MRPSKLIGKYQALEHRYVPESDLTDFPVVMHTSAIDWVSVEARLAAKTASYGNILNTAVALAAFRLLAERHKMRPQLLVPDEHDMSPMDVPPWETFRRSDSGNTRLTLHATPSTFSLLSWASRLRRPPANPDTMLHNGVLTLGALAVLPAGSVLGVHIAGELVCLETNIIVAGADPYPSPVET